MPSQKDELEKLWHKLVFSEVGTSIEADRISLGMAVIREKLTLIKDTFDNAEQLSEVSLDDQASLRKIWFAQALGIFQLLANELLYDFPDVLRSLCEEDKIPAAPQPHLSYLLSLMEPIVIDPPDRRLLSTCAVVMPRSLLVTLKDAVWALAQGEVHDILRPKKTKLHGDAYSWENARLLACQHVFFLLGSGLTKTAAQAKVSGATGIGVETLRGWEREFKKHPTAYPRSLFRLAEEAGRVFQAKDEKLCNGYVSNALETLQGKSLEIFGHAYRRQHGHRHNQVKSCS